MSSMVKSTLFVLLLIPALFSAQHKNPFNKKFSTIEMIYGVGCANYLGELGGGNKIGTHKSPIDLELKQTRPSLTIGFRKMFSQYRAIRTNLSLAQVGGNDQLTKEPFRQNRNLNFKSNIIELSLNYELGFRNVQSGQRYLSKVQGIRNRDHYQYFFGGVALFYYNPKGRYNNEWYALQPLGTEGQGLNGKKKYSRIAVAIPLGAGFKTKIKQRHHVGIEFGYRFTFTDYLDDVSTTYYDNNYIAAQNGSIAAHFADPSLNKLHKEVTAGGEQRGNALQNDGYFLLTINYSKESFKRGKGMFSRY